MKTRNLTIAALITINLITINTLSAQNDKLTGGINFLQEYLKSKSTDDLDKSKKCLDLAAYHEKTKVKAKTWKSRGDTYLTILLDGRKNPAIAAIAPNAIDSAVVSYKKAYDLEPKGEYSKESFKRVESLSNEFNNNGVEAYNTKNYEKALLNFEKAVATKQLIGQVDTMGIQNSSAAAYLSKNYVKAAEYAEKMADLKKEPVKYYTSAYQYYKQAEQKEKALTVLKKARTAYPENMDLLKTEIFYYNDNNQPELAENLLKEATEKDPTNLVLQVLQGNLYDKKGEVDKALACFDKAVAADPNSHIAHFNLGAMYLKMANTKQKDADNLKDMKKYDLVKKDINVLLDKSANSLEKAVSILDGMGTLNTDDKDTRNEALKQLKNTYLRLNKMDRAKDAENRIK